MPVELVCEVCGETFKVKPSWVEDRHTCSRECSGKRHSKIMKGHPYYGGGAPKGHPAWGGFETRWTRARTQNPDFIRKRLKGLMKKPTKPERLVIDLMKKHSLPFKYVGDGRENIGTLNPDFIHEDARKVIEVFGRAFHDPAASFFPVRLNSQPEGRKEVFKQHGYDCLVLWDDELDSEDFILSSITDFMEE